MQHMMIDIETLGSGPTAPVMAVAAAMFDPVGIGHIQSPMYANVELDQQIKKAWSKPDAETIQWWLHQSDAARTRLYDPTPIEPQSAIMALCNYHNTYNPEAVWANGATFDFPILDNMARESGKRLPWHYRAVRDMRTLMNLWVDTGQQAITVQRTTLKHDAQEDVLHQILVAQKYYLAFRHGKSPMNVDAVKGALHGLLDEVIKEHQSDY